LEPLKLSLSHELVHVAQFSRHPTLLDEYVALRRRLAESNLAMEAAHRAEAWRWLQVGHPAAALWAWRETVLPVVDTESAHARRLWSLMANLESYATYLEADFLQQIFTCGRHIESVSLARLAASGLLRAVGRAVDEAEADAHYLAAVPIYRARQQRQRKKLAPAPFDPRLRVGLPDRVRLRSSRI